MPGHRTLAATALTLLALISNGEAQAQILLPGIRVRVTGPCLVTLPSGLAQCAVETGRVRYLTPDSIMFQQGSGADRAVALSATRSVEVSDGRRSYKGLGTLIGGGIGMGISLAVVPSIICDAEEITDPYERLFFLYTGCAMGALATVSILTLVGAVVGRTVGAMIKSERWVSLPNGVATVAVAPRGSAGVGLSLKIRF